MDLPPNVAASLLTIAGSLLTVAWWLFLAVIALLLLTMAYNLAYRLLLPGSPRNHPPLELAGKKVLLTGASSGIGLEMARIMHAKGARLILASRSVDRLEKLCAELNEQPPVPSTAAAKNGGGGQAAKMPPRYQAQFCRLDLEEVANDAEKLANFVADVRRLLPEDGNAKVLDVLVNNAGQMAYGRGRCTQLAVLRRMLDVNYLGPVAISQALMPLIPDRGAVVLLGSIVGRVALPWMGAYSAAKHAVQAFFDSLRAEDRPQLHILTVSAGYVNTALGPCALDERGHPVGQPDPGQLAGMDAGEAARQVVAALQRRETDLLLAPFVPRFLLSLRLATPNLLWFFLHRNLGPIYGNMGKCGEGDN